MVLPVPKPCQLAQTSPSLASLPEAPSLVLLLLLFVRHLNPTELLGMCFVLFFDMHCAVMGARNDSKGRTNISMCGEAGKGVPCLPVHCYVCFVTNTVKITTSQARTTAQWETRLLHKLEGLILVPIIT